MVTLILFIILLGSIIFIHEGGHFLFAKLTEYMFMNSLLVWGLNYLVFKKR